jgi:hypothetical protein
VLPLLVWLVGSHFRVRMTTQRSKLSLSWYPHSKHECKQKTQQLTLYS